ncbi:putative mfs quinate [Phaeomoniella chlamydospora]|uniref:Putative mfs quinate n=1 Tax=Phaeomoniella chlamydospora TaxID=158046 RepID=A0A0G2DUI0_PHACM|nr:putative mfs quinate [Phaeomoniella chlamydospora]
MSWLLRKVVHNEAIKEDPPQIYGWRVFFLACSACFGGMLFGIETGIIGGVLTLEPFKRKYGLLNLSDKAKANLSANIVSTLQAGCFVGALAASPISDKFGRKPALLIAAVVATIGAIMQTSASGHLAAMYVGRFINGMGVGTASAITPLYISENAPRAIRGALTGLYQLFIVTGVMLAFWINYGAALHLSGTALYVVPLSMQILPAILLLFFMLFNNESPRFLAKQDRWEDAKRVLARVRNLPQDHPYIESEFQDIVTVIENERALIGGASFMALQKEMWLIKGNRRRTLISITLMICQQMTGTNALNYYAPEIFANLGVTGTRSGLFATGIYGVVKMTACSLFLILAADSLGRRRSLLWSSIAQGLCMYYIAIYVRIHPPDSSDTNASRPAAGYVSLVAIYLFAACYQFATQWLFNFVVARSVTTMLATMGKGGYGTYFLFGSFCFSMFIFTWFFIPETKGMSLEKMDDLFGVTELVKAKLRDEDEERHSAKRGLGDAEFEHVEQRGKGLT